MRIFTAILGSILLAGAAQATECTHTLREVGKKLYFVEIRRADPFDVAYEEFTQDGRAYRRYTISCSKPMALPAGNQYKIQLRYLFGFMDGFRMSVVHSVGLLAAVPHGAVGRVLIDGNPDPIPGAPGASLEIPPTASAAAIEFGTPFPGEYLRERPLQVLLQGGFEISKVSVTFVNHQQ